MLDNDYPTLWYNPSFQQLDIQNTDNLAEATLLALETGEITPLVKEELKYTIQSRRLAQGKEELGVNFVVSEPIELREDEKEKIVRRREQNKLAARRFRQRRRAKGPLLIKKIQDLESDNTKKVAELRSIRKEMEELKGMFQNHLMVCPSVAIHTCDNTVYQ